MTVLASVFGASEEADYEKACARLRDSQDFYESHIYKTLEVLRKELGAGSDQLLKTLYLETAPPLYELSQDKGMDLYGFIYEELATKDTKKEQGEYYTPRHTIRPILQSVFRHYLKWDKDELAKKIVLDPFCGSGGFLYEYIHLQKTLHNLKRAEVDRIASKSVFGMDKREPTAAYLNLYLIGDGSANLCRVSTTINWRQEFLRYASASAHSAKISDGKTLTAKVNSRSADLLFMLKLYSPLQVPKENFSKRLIELGLSNSSSPIDTILEEHGEHSEARSGNVDLLLTNVPYGKIADPLEQFTDGEQTPYGRSLEANSLRECIDLIRPAIVENGKVVREGGVGITIVPDSILENPSNKAIRDYLISRCDVKAIISLPPFTFSPYAMEKTYALVFRKRAPEQFDLERDLTKDNVFMYYSLSDGKANSVNRFTTDHLTTVTTKVVGGKKRIVAEYLHNDFDACFDSYFEDKSLYLSKLERSWDSATWFLNPDWDQLRIREEWNGATWRQEPGRKWGFFHLRREKRIVREVVKAKSLQQKLEAAVPMCKLFGEGTLWQSTVELSKFATELTDKEQQVLISLAGAEIVQEGDVNSLILFKEMEISDVIMNPNNASYLGRELPKRKTSKIFEELTALQEVTEDSITDFFRSPFTADVGDEFPLSERFEVLQGTQFSKADAYRYPGAIPVYTAATDGPAYFCRPDIPGKVVVHGPVLIWSRKGAKAGTIQVFKPAGEETRCYITDVSGAVKAKHGMNLDMTFLRFFLAGQVKAKIQAQDNNAQLNKSSLEALRVSCPPDHEQIGEWLRVHLDPGN